MREEILIRSVGVLGARPSARRDLAANMIGCEGLAEKSAAWRNKSRGASALEPERQQVEAGVGIEPAYADLQSAPFSF